MSSTRRVLSQINATQSYGISGSTPGDDVVKPDISEEVASYDENFRPLMQNTLLRLMEHATEEECKNILEACKLVRPVILKLALSRDGLDFDHASAWHAIVAQLVKLDASARLEYLRSLQRDPPQSKITYALQQLVAVLVKHDENNLSCHLQEIVDDNVVQRDGHLPNEDVFKAIIRSWSSAQLAENFPPIIVNALDHKTVHPPSFIEAYAPFFLKTVEKKLRKTSVLEELTERLLSQASPETLAALKSDPKFAKLLPETPQAETTASQDTSIKKRKPG